MGIKLTSMYLDRLRMATDRPKKIRAMVARALFVPYLLSIILTFAYLFAGLPYSILQIVPGQSSYLRSACIPCVFLIIIGSLLLSLMFRVLVSAVVQKRVDIDLLVMFFSLTLALSWSIVRVAAVIVDAKLP